MQTVRQVIEYLGRFNPDARMLEDVEVQGVSPATACRIEVVGDDTLAERMADLEDERDGLDDDLTNALNALSIVKERLDAGKVDEAKKAVTAALSQ